MPRVRYFDQRFPAAAHTMSGFWIVLISTTGNRGASFRNARAMGELDFRLMNDKV